MLYNYVVFRRSILSSDVLDLPMLILLTVLEAQDDVGSIGVSVTSTVNVHDQVVTKIARKCTIRRFPEMSIGTVGANKVTIQCLATGESDDAARRKIWAGVLLRVKK